MDYKVGDRIIINNTPIYCDIMDDIREYFINKNGFIVDITEHIYQSSKYFDINISGKIYTFCENDFTLDTVYYRELKLGKILDNDKI